MKMYVWYLVDDPDYYHQGTIAAVAESVEQAKDKVRRLGIIGENAARRNPDEDIDANSPDCVVYVSGGE